MDAELTPLMEDPNVAASLRADLGVAKGAVVEGFDAAAGLTALEASIAAEAAVGAGTAAASGSILTKAVIGAVLIGGAAVAWMASQGPSEPEVVSGPVAIVEPSAEAPAPEPEAPQPAVVAPIPEEEPEAIEDEVELVVDDEPETATVKPRKPKVKPAPKETLEERLLREAKMVADARKALASNPSRALQLARQAAKDFPKGQLVEEREALQIRALAKLGRTEQARTKAERYLDKHPRGPHADAVRRAVDMP